MRKILPVFIVFALSLAPLPAPAATGAEDRAIQHLIDFVSSSGGLFVRDGVAYNTREAASYLDMKYGYVRSRVDTADEFIDVIAAKSALSNVPYRVLVNGNQLTAEEWLREELRRYRSEANRSR